MGMSPITDRCNVPQWSNMKNDFYWTNKTVLISIPYHEYKALKKGVEENSGRIYQMLSKGTRIYNEYWEDALDNLRYSLVEKLSMRLNSNYLNDYDKSIKSKYFFVDQMDFLKMTFFQRVKRYVTNENVLVRFHYVEMNPKDKEIEEVKTKKIDFNAIDVFSSFEMPNSSLDRKIGYTKVQSQNVSKRNKRVNNPHNYSLEYVKQGRSFTLIDGGKK